MILVSGASGLLGQHLLEALCLSAKKVRALYAHTLPKIYTTLDSTCVEWVRCDILDIVALQQAMQDCTQVYHCAAMVSYDSRKKQEMFEVNVEGTANVVNVCLANGIEKLVYVSSIAALGDKQSGELSDENNYWNEESVSSNYARSKYQAEMEVWRGVAEGLNAVIINPGIILGEGDPSKSSTNLFKIVYDEFPYYTQGVTSWVDAKDVARCMLALMESTIQGERFIVSEGNYSYREIFTFMANAMNKKPPSKFANKWMTELVWRIAYLKSLFNGTTATITKETAKAAHQMQRFNNKKLLNALPNFSYTPIYDCIGRIAKGYRN